MTEHHPVEVEVEVFDLDARGGIDVSSRTVERQIRCGCDGTNDHDWGTGPHHA